MKKRVFLLIIAIMVMVSNVLPTAAALNNGGSLDIGSGAGDAIDWDSIGSDYYVAIGTQIKTIGIGETFSPGVIAYSESQGELSNFKVKWSSDNPEIAAVDAKGVVTGVSVGTIHINAEAYGYKVCCIVTVEERQTDCEVPKIKSVSLSKSKFVYNGKVQKPSVKIVNERGEVLVEGKDYTLTYSAGRKAVGTYQVVVKYKGQYVDYANVKKTFDIVPQGTELKKLSPGKKKLTITWKKQTKETSGYQIQCSLKKNFKQVATVTVSGKKKSKVSLSGLKAKKNYFVRIRTYKNVKTNGKTVKSYSNWSDVKKIKTK